jgi:hypothetical protein
MSLDHRERPEVGQVCWLDEETAELSLLLPGWQAAELESLACSWCLTLGQLLRLLIRDFLRCQKDPGTASERVESGRPGW